MDKNYVKHKISKYTYKYIISANKKLITFLTNFLVTNG